MSVPYQGNIDDYDLQNKLLRIMVWLRKQEPYNAAHILSVATLKVMTRYKDMPTEKLKELVRIAIEEADKLIMNSPKDYVLANDFVAIYQVAMFSLHRNAASGVALTHGQSVFNYMEENGLVQK